MVTTASHVRDSDDHGDTPRPQWLGLGASKTETTFTRVVAAYDAHPHPLMTLFIAVYAAVPVPTWRSQTNLEGGPVVVFGITTVALLTMVASPRRWWIVRGGVPLLAGAAMYLQGEGEVLTAWIPLALVSVAWAVADRSPLPLRKRVAPGGDVMVGILTFAAFNAFPLAMSWQPLAVLAIGPVLLLVTNGRQPTVGRWLDGAGAAVERFLVRLGAAAVAIVVLALRWVGRALFRDRTAGWTSVEEQLADPRRARRPDRRSLRPGWGPATAVLASVAVAALVIRVALPFFTGGSTPFESSLTNSAQSLGVVQPDDPIPAAYSDASWYPDFRTDMAWVTDERVAWQPLAVQRVLDVETPTVNVHDRVRDSWTAPPCDCKRVTAWLYGGSGAFGLGQRDDHTIASELARLAEADGVALDVQNRGIPGEMHWRNATRFSWDLTVDPNPDLTVFYEGAEEVDSELALRSRGLADVRAPFEAFATNLYDEVVGVPPGTPETPDGVDYVGWPELDPDPGSPGQLAATRYDRSRIMSARTSDAFSVPVRYFWQPSRYGGPAATAVAQEDLRGQIFRNAPTILDDEVVDLSEVLDETDEALFYDDVNHNEVAARQIAAAMWEELRPQVLDLADS